jgi:hypothetical protein
MLSVAATPATASAIGSVHKVGAATPGVVDAFVIAPQCLIQASATCRCISTTASEAATALWEAACIFSVTIRAFSRASVRRGSTSPAAIPVLRMPMVIAEAVIISLQRQTLRHMSKGRKAEGDWERGIVDCLRKAVRVRATPSTCCVAQ